MPTRNILLINRLSSSLLHTLALFPKGTTLTLHKSDGDRASLDNLLHSVLGALGPPVVVQLGLHQGCHDGRGVAASRAGVAVTVVKQPEPARHREVTASTETWSKHIKGLSDAGVAMTVVKQPELTCTTQGSHI